MLLYDDIDTGRIREEVAQSIHDEYANGGRIVFERFSWHELQGPTPEVMEYQNFWDKQLNDVDDVEKKMKRQRRAKRIAKKKQMEAEMAKCGVVKNKRAIKIKKEFVGTQEYDSDAFDKLTLAQLAKLR